MPFKFVSPAYSERGKHSSLYNKMKDVCEIWLMNDVVKIEEFQPENAFNFDPSIASYNQESEISSRLVSYSSIWTMPDWSQEEKYCPSSTKTQITITFFGVCAFEVPEMLSRLMQDVGRGDDAHVMARPTEYKEDSSTVWKKI